MLNTSRVCRGNPLYFLFVVYSWLFKCFFLFWVTRDALTESLSHTCFNFRMKMDVSFSLQFFYCLNIFDYLDHFLFWVILVPLGTITESFSHSCYLLHANGCLLFSVFFWFVAYSWLFKCFCFTQGNPY